MKRWAIVTVLLYALALVLLTVPGVQVLSLTLPWSEEGFGSDATLSEAAEIFEAWAYWVWLGVMVTCQALLLLIPVSTAGRRPEARRPIVWPMLVASFLLANLCLAGVFSVGCAFLGDEFFEAFKGLHDLTAATLQLIPSLWAALTSAGMTNTEWIALANVLAVTLVLWMLWGWAFYHFSRADEPENVHRRAVRWLLRGSILDLLVAVPSHVVVRGRDDCCAGFATFWGLVTGASVMLLAFGPGVFFLFAERIRRKQARGAPALSSNIS